MLLSGWDKRSDMTGSEHRAKSRRIADALHTGRIRALFADEKGVAAVEFALVATPFLALLFAILQTSLVLFAGQFLQTQANNASRKLMTGQLAGQSVNEFRTELCSATLNLFDCSKFLFQVESFEDFSEASATGFITADCFNPDKADPETCYNPGGASDIVVVRIVYPWPFGISLDKLGQPHDLVALSAFRAEPY